ncbi:MAG: hypothetical protein JNG83_10565 [Opitutaceae bacterium]|nr:hypothetical protein [Opitutaceae bacterium]
MKTDRTRWHGWDAVRCVAGDCELLVGVSTGPRILSLRRGDGDNVLYRDTTDFGVGDWRLYGGHRFTVAPEEDRSYVPDNARCGVEVADGELRVAAPAGPDGTRRHLVIRAAEDGAGFDLRHVLVNGGREPWQGALWAITCVPHAAQVVAPRGPTPLRFWPGIEAVAWQLAPGYVALTPNRARGKIGWYSQAGWLASLQREATLVIHSPDIPPEADCVDGGCNVELFTCSDYVELETLGGRVTLPPGGHTEHRQRWRLLAPGYTPRDWPAIAAQAGCAAAPTAPASSP